MPDILAPEGKAVGLQPHRFIGHRTGENDQIGPTDLVAVFFLDRPKQTPRLVQVDVVGPAVDRGKPLIARAGTAATVCDPVGAGRVPGHANHQTAVMPPVRGPPILAVGHQSMQIFLERLDVERLDRFTIVEVRPHRIGLGVVLMQDVEVQRLRPPVHDRCSCGRISAVHHRAFPGSRRHSLVHFYLRSWLHGLKSVCLGCSTSTKRKYGLLRRMANRLALYRRSLMTIGSNYSIG